MMLIYLLNVTLQTGPVFLSNDMQESGEMGREKNE